VNKGDKSRSQRHRREDEYFDEEYEDELEAMRDIEEEEDEADPWTWMEEYDGYDEDSYSDEPYEDDP
jgi:hypothetical protein